MGTRDDGQRGRVVGKGNTPKEEPELPAGSHRNSFPTQQGVKGTGGGEASKSHFLNICHVPDSSSGSLSISNSPVGFTLFPLR